MTSTIDVTRISRSQAALVLALLFTLSHGAAGADSTIVIGALANRGVDECVKHWTPTAEYLTDALPGYSFSIAPLGYDEFGAAVERGEIAFILTTPGFYVEMEILHGAERIATLKGLVDGRPVTRFGGVVFCRKDRSNIRSLADLKGKSFMATHEQSLGGWLAVWRELDEQGVAPQRFFSELSFGGDHDAVVRAVREGRVDAGSVRTGVLEQMASEGAIDLADFHIIDLTERLAVGGRLDLLQSTRLYPEWPLAKVDQVSDELAEKVAVALIGMPADSAAAQAAQYAGWTVPHNYQPVRDCLKALRIGPYKDFGKVTPAQVLRQYWPAILTFVIVAAAIALFAAYVTRLNRKYRAAIAFMKQELSKREWMDEEPD